MANQLRKSNAKRIRSQKSSDGDDYAARKKVQNIQDIRFKYKDRHGNVTERSVRSTVGTKKHFPGRDRTARGMRTFKRESVLAIYHSRAVKTKAAQKMLLGMTKRQVLKVQVSDDSLQVGYDGVAAKIAGVHHFGARVKVGKRTIKMPERQLLGVDQNDKKVLADFLLQNLVKTRHKGSVTSSKKQLL